MRLDVEERSQVKSAADWMLVAAAVTVVCVVVFVFRIGDDPWRYGVTAVVAAALSLPLARAGHALIRDPSPASLEAGLLQLRSFFRAAVVCVLAFGWAVNCEVSHGVNTYDLGLTVDDHCFRSVEMQSGAPVIGPPDDAPSPISEVATHNAADAAGDQAREVSPNLPSFRETSHGSGVIESWSDLAAAMKPCLEMDANALAAWLWSSDMLSDVQDALSVASCRDVRMRAARFLEASGPDVLAEFDAKVAAYSKGLALHEAYAARDFPRTEDREALKVSMERVHDDFPSFAAQRETVKIVMRGVLNERRWFSCQGSVEQVLLRTRTIESRFAPGIPVDDVARREEAIDGVKRAHSTVRRDCPNATDLLASLAGLVEEAGLILDNHDRLIRPSRRGIWRSPTLRVTDEATRLEPTTLAVYRDVALYVATSPNP